MFLSSGSVAYCRVVVDQRLVGLDGSYKCSKLFSAKSRACKRRVRVHAAFSHFDSLSIVDTRIVHNSDTSRSLVLAKVLVNESEENDGSIGLIIRILLNHALKYSTQCTMRQPLPYYQALANLHLIFFSSLSSSSLTTEIEDVQFCSALVLGAAPVQVMAAHLVLA